MPDAVHQQPLFADAIEIPAKLEADRATPYEARVHRDRRIASELGTVDALTQVREWGRRTSTIHFEAGDTNLAHRLVRARRLISIVMVVLGLVVGALTSLAVFHYDGTWPVNVVTVLATLVLLQLLLICFTCLMMLPHVPGISFVQDLLGDINPGALVAAIYRRISRIEASDADLFVWHEARGPAAARFARWQMLAWSQAAAVAFNLAALAAAAGLIAFTDLAFGWSTTLEISTTEALRITNVLSAPWQQLWPAAVPTADLIETSRFFRLATAAPNIAPPVELTGWWPFLLAAILTYGLVPRCILMVLSALQLHTATRRLLLEDPRVRALLDRMRTVEIQLGATQAEELAIQRASQSGRAPLTDADALAIVWSNSIPRGQVHEWTATHLQRRVKEIFEAGAGALNADERVIEELAQRSSNIILILVRAWEAPLLDLQDFLATLRTRVGAERSLIVAPVGEDHALASEAQRAVWSRWAARAGDSALYVESGA